MSVIGLGTDIVAVARIDAVRRRHGDRFLRRCFRDAEVEDVVCGSATGAPELARRWAAKEACLKALGGDVSRVPYRDVEVVGAAGNTPRLVLHGAAAERLCGRGGRRVHLALAGAGGHVAALVVVED